LSEQEKLTLVFLVAFVIGLAVFAGTLVFIWKNRSDAMTQRAAKAGAFLAAAAGLVSLSHYALLGNEPDASSSRTLLLLLYMAPTFVIGFHIRLIWLQRSGARQDRN